MNTRKDSLDMKSRTFIKNEHITNATTEAVHIALAIEELNILLLILKQTNGSDGLNLSPEQGHFCAKIRAK